MIVKRIRTLPKRYSSSNPFATTYSPKAIIDPIHRNGTEEILSAGYPPVGPLSARTFAKTSIAFCKNAPLAKLACESTVAGFKQ